MKSNTKPEKPNTIKRSGKLQKIVDSIQIVEICLILILVATQIPEAFKISGVFFFFRDLPMSPASPCSVFLIGNAIIIVLLAKSGHFQAQVPTRESSGTDLYREFMEQSENGHRSRRGFQIKTEENRAAKIKRSQSVNLNLNLNCIEKSYENCEKIVPSTDLNLDCTEKMVPEKLPEMGSSGERKEVNEEHKMSNEEFRVTGLNLDCNEKRGSVLRRSESEKLPETGSSGVGKVDREEKMSNKEFRSKIEAFIARQQRMRRGESV